MVKFGNVADTRFRGPYIMDLWSWITLNRSRDDLGSFAMISWCIWLDKYQLVCQGKALPPKDAQASSLWEQSLACQPVISPKNLLPSLYLLVVHHHQGL